MGEGRRKRDREEMGEGTDKMEEREGGRKKGKKGGMEAGMEEGGDEGEEREVVEREGGGEGSMIPMQLQTAEPDFEHTKATTGSLPTWSSSLFLCSS